MKAEEEQIKKFWEACGWYWNGAYWFPPNHEHSVAKLPPTDLNNLFEWVKPKLSLPDNELDEIRFHYNHNEGNITCEIERQDDYYYGFGDTEEDAFFNACYKVLVGVK